VHGPSYDGRAEAAAAAGGTGTDLRHGKVNSSLELVVNSTQSPLGKMALEVPKPLPLGSGTYQNPSKWMSGWVWIVVIAPRRFPRSLG
jgi:hypothetical protein